MNYFKLILRSFRHNAFKQAGAFFGAVVASGVLIGALVVGDSVRLSLQKLASMRLGKTAWALSSDDRLFRGDLAAELAREIQRPAAAVLSLPAVATASDGSARANQVHLLGVDSDFWNLAPVPGAAPQIPEDGVALNQALSNQLNAQVGDMLVLRVHKPSAVSRDSLLSKTEDSTVALRVRVSSILTEENFGRFSLLAGQMPALNAFIGIDYLRNRIKEPRKANLLLVGRDAKSFLSPESLSAAELGAKLAKCWKLEDGQLSLKLGSRGSFDLRTSRVFLDAATESGAQQAADAAVPILTYFVNELGSGGKSTPYSMISALPPSLIGAPLEDSEILVSKWMADDLSVQVGSRISMKYYIAAPGRQLEEREAAFQVRGILELSSPTLDQGLIPDFPGLTDAENCRDWDAGFPIESDRLRDKDQEYWEAHKHLPKGVITLRAGQKLWENRFGKATAVRFPAMEAAALEQKLQGALSPAVLGLVFDPVGQQAVRSVSESQDFGGLFLGFSMFLIASSLILMGLLFRLGLEQRSNEVGVLLAMGFQPLEVRNLVLAEGLVLVAAAGLAGVLAGVAYAKAMILGLATIWNDAVGITHLDAYHTPFTLALGWLASVLAAGATLWLGVRRFTQVPARVLLDSSSQEAAESSDGSAADGNVTRGSKLKVAFSRRWALVALAFSTGGLIWALIGDVQTSAGAFFAVGALNLAGWLGLAKQRLDHYSHLSFAAGIRISPSELALRNAARRSRRSLATIAILACGAFVVISVGVFRLDESRDASSRKSGTGGFELFGEASLPVVHDLNSKSGLEFHAMDGPGMEGVRLVQFRVRSGDEASCLNLNRAQRPRVIGVNPQYLKGVDAFSFAQHARGYPSALGWGLLSDTNLTAQSSKDGVKEFPAIVDQASAQWALGKRVGETLDLVDEKGRSFRLRLVATLANSILQGNIIVSEEVFLSVFPSEAGYRMFLVDAPSNRIDQVSALLTKNLEDMGVEWQKTTSRLESFNAVQNTYLSTFQLLGGLGLVVGCFGLGAVVLRNVFERRGELASFAAFGFSRLELVKIVALEHVGLLVAGLAIAMFGAAVAVLPSWLERGEALLPSSLGYTLLGVVANGILWASVASFIAIRKRPAEVLRDS